MPRYYCGRCRRLGWSSSSLFFKDDRRCHYRRLPWRNFYKMADVVAPTTCRDVTFSRWPTSSLWLLAVNFLALEHRTRQVGVGCDPSLCCLQPSCVSTRPPSPRNDCSTPLTYPFSEIWLQSSMADVGCRHGTSVSRRRYSPEVVDAFIIHASVTLLPSVATAFRVVTSSRWPKLPEKQDSRLLFSAFLQITNGTFSHLFEAHPRWICRLLQSWLPKWCHDSWKFRPPYHCLLQRRIRKAEERLRPANVLVLFYFLSNSCIQLAQCNATEKIQLLSHEGRVPRGPRFSLRPGAREDAKHLHPGQFYPSNMHSAVPKELIHTLCIWKSAILSTRWWKRCAMMSRSSPSYSRFQENSSQKTTSTDDFTSTRMHSRAPDFPKTSPMLGFLIPTPLRAPNYQRKLTTTTNNWKN